jgi:lysophospholipase L1-like esterase
MKRNFYNNYFTRFFFPLILIKFIFPLSIYPQNVRILPLGDSITRDIFNANPRPDSLLTGYRQPLWLLLKSKGYPVNFVGSDSSGYGAVPKFDPDNAGFGGYSTGQLLHLLKTGYDVKGNEVTNGPYLDYYTPDIILLHIGTNQLDSSTADLQDLLNYIDDFEDTTNTRIWIILAKIINRVPYSLTTTIYNNNIQKMAEQRIKNGDDIKLVDMENNAGIVYKIDTVAPYINGDLYDGIHPNKSGYTKMANLFFDTLQVLLNKIIPVELVSFSSVSKEDSVVLSWQTALELNNSGFFVERSSGGGAWDELGFVNGSGTTHHIQNYSFTDDSLPASNTYEYRLKQVDSNGKFEYLGSLYVNVKVTTALDNYGAGTPKQFSLEQNYPNPFNPSTVIKYNVAEESRINLSIYNILGERIATLVNETQKPGIYEKTWTANNLASGVYFYILNAASVTGQHSYHFSKKMMLLK